MTGLCVLLVDDDDGDRKAIKRFLDRSGLDLSIEEARSTDELKDLTTAHIDAIFLDYLLPGASGLNVLASVKARWPQAAIFMITGQGDEQLAKSAIQLGATDYISKSSLSVSSLSQMMTSGINNARSQWKLDEQMKDLATFSEVLVHDFKAPIRAVSYLVDQILEDIELADYDGVGESARLLRTSTRNMLETIKSLSDHIRFDREDKFADTNVGSLVDRALNAVAHEVRTAQAKMDIQLESSNSPISCRAPQIAQVLQNLIANSIKYSEGRSIHITIRHHIRSHAHVFEVEDKGMGVAQDQIDRIFEPFKRAPGAHGISGTGLGLATCKKIIMRHNGKIWCRSELGTGTCVRFELPLQMSPEVGLKGLDKSVVPHGTA